MNRIEYYDRMTQVRRTGDYEQWISFFLQAFADSAEDAIHTITDLLRYTIKAQNYLTLLQKGSVLVFLKCFLIWNPIRSSIFRKPLRLLKCHTTLCRRWFLSWLIIES